MPYRLFVKFTSQKPEFRTQPTEMINPTVRNHPAWVQLKGNQFYQHSLRHILRNDRYNQCIKEKMRSAPPGERCVIYNYKGGSTATLTFARWVPLTVPNILSSLNKRLLRSSPHKKLGLNDAYQNTSRCKSLKLSDQILYSYCRDTRFVLFLSIFFGYVLWMYIAPAVILNVPLSQTSPDLQQLVRVVEDTYVNHVCSTHPDVISPCDCGEPLNQTARNMYKDKVFDPLGCSGKIKTAAVMVASIIIVLTLTESVSPYGVFHQC